jgi:hypothetical protein
MSQKPIELGYPAEDVFFLGVEDRSLVEQDISFLTALSADNICCNVMRQMARAGGGAKNLPCAPEGG